MPAQVFQEWSDQQRTVRYPFDDQATLINAQGTAIPFDLFRDASLYPSQSSGVLYLSLVSVRPADVTLAISDSRQERGRASFSKASIPESLYFRDALGRPAGHCVMSSISASSIAGLPQGKHVFNASQTPFASSTIVPMPEGGVSGFLVGDELFSGHVKMVAEDGVYFREYDGVVRLDAIGDPLFLRKACVDEGGDQDSLNAGPFLETLNDEPPDDQGRFYLNVGQGLVDDSVLRIERVGHGIRFKLVATK